MLIFSCPQFNLTLNNNRFININKPPEDTEGEAPEVEKKPDIALRIGRVADKLASFSLNEYLQDNQEARETIEQNGQVKDLLDFITDRIRSFIGDNASVIDNIISSVHSDKRKGVIKSIQELSRGYAKEVTEMACEVLLMRNVMAVDPLTGLPNRKAYDDHMEKAIDRSSRTGEGFSYVIFDLDKFKNVNDTHGHGAGDEVLVETARRITENVRLRKLDLVARYGGEEFVMILPNTSAKGACIAALRASEAIASEKFSIVDNDGNEKDITVTASMGVSEYRGKKEDPKGEEVKRAADNCLYVLKGERPDAEGVTDNRRGQIALGEMVLDPEAIKTWQVEMQKSGERESLAPADIINLDDLEG